MTENGGVQTPPVPAAAPNAPPPPWASLMALPVGPEDERFAIDYPPAWHEGLSVASTLLGPLGISATKYVRAEASLRERLVDDLAKAAARRLLGRTFVCATVALAFLVTLSGPLRGFALAACALKAGSDLANYFGRKRTLDEIWSLTEDDLELTKPKDEE